MNENERPGPGVADLEALLRGTAALELLDILREALAVSVHNPSCAYLHHDVDPREVQKCSCWMRKAAKVLDVKIPPATGVDR